MLFQPALLIGVGPVGETVLTQLAIRLRQVAAAKYPPAGDRATYGAEAFENVALLGLGFAAAAASSDPAVTRFSLFSRPQEWLWDSADQRALHPLLRDWFDGRANSRRLASLKSGSDGHLALEPFDRQLARSLYLSFLHRQGTVLKIQVKDHIGRARHPERKTLRVMIAASLGDVEGSALLPDIGLLVRALAEQEHLTCRISLHVCSPFAVGSYGGQADLVRASSFAALHEIERFAWGTDQPAGMNLFYTPGSGLDDLQTGSRLFDYLVYMAHPPLPIVNPDTAKTARNQVIANLTDALMVDLLPGSGEMLAQMLQNRDAKLRDAIPPESGLIPMFTDTASAMLPLFHLQTEWTARLVFMAFAQWVNPAAASSELYQKWIRGSQTLLAPLPDVFFRLGSESSPQDWRQVGKELRGAFATTASNDPGEQVFTEENLPKIVRGANSQGMTAGEFRGSLRDQLQRFVGKIDPSIDRDKRGGAYANYAADGRRKGLEAARSSLEAFVQRALSELSVNAAQADLADFSQTLLQAEKVLKAGLAYTDSQLRLGVERFFDAFEQLVRLFYLGKETGESARFREAALNVVELAKLDVLLDQARQLVIVLRADVRSLMDTLNQWQTFLAVSVDVSLRKMLTRTTAPALGTLMNAAEWVNRRYDQELAPLIPTLLAEIGWKVELNADGVWSLLLLRGDYTFDLQTSAAERLAELWFEAAWELVVARTRNLTAWDYIFQTRTNLSPLHWLESVLSQNVGIPDTVAANLPLAPNFHHYLLWPMRDRLDPETWGYIEGLKQGQAALLHQPPEEVSDAAPTHVMRFSLIDHIPLRRLQEWDRARRAYDRVDEEAGKRLWVHPAETWAAVLASFQRSNPKSRLMSSLEFSASTMMLLQAPEKLETFGFAYEFGLIHLAEVDTDGAWVLEIPAAQKHETLSLSWLSTPTARSNASQGIDWLPEAVKRFCTNQPVQMHGADPDSLAYDRLDRALQYALNARKEAVCREPLPPLFNEFPLLEQLHRERKLDPLAPKLVSLLLVESFSNWLRSRLGETSGDTYQTLALLILNAEYRQHQLKSQIRQDTLALA